MEIGDALSVGNCLYVLREMHVPEGFGIPYDILEAMRNGKVVWMEDEAEEWITVFKSSRRSAIFTWGWPDEKDMRNVVGEDQSSSKLLLVYQKLL